MAPVYAFDRGKCLFRPSFLKRPSGFGITVVPYTCDENQKPILIFSYFTVCSLGKRRVRVPKRVYSSRY